MVAKKNAHSSARTTLSVYGHMWLCLEEVFSAGVEGQGLDEGWALTDSAGYS